MTTTTPATLPTYDRFIEPLLRFLAGRPEGAPAREAHEAAADALGLDAALARDGRPPRDSGVLRVGSHMIIGPYAAGHCTEQDRSCARC